MAKETAKKRVSIILVREIQWDTDGVPASKLGLPKRIVIPEEETTSEMLKAVRGDSEAIADYLSDRYGFCIYGYNAICIRPERGVVDVIKAILNFMVEMADEFPPAAEISPAIIYANGNDGTGFDWCMNDRTCEFMCYYAEAPCYGYMKVWLEKTGYVAGVAFNGDNIQRGKDLLAEKLCSPETAKKVARYLDYLEDKHGDVWNVVVGSLG